MQENFIVSARKYRPTTFDTVVGQEHISTTLKNAIKSQHLAQAFLFCGPRGVGKTTCARILAKTINCFNITSATEACDVCPSCISFNEGRSLNILELDAASNNSVEDIRHLIDQVRFAPQLGSRKIYIIDEVHMLSTAAFNALLKTLEEPPAHALFILATTERHKILPTILSRCQIFDFKRIQIQDIAQHLSSIAKKENVIADEDALHLIAQKADGGLRDALSMFDQMVTFCGDSLSYRAVVENLNVLDVSVYFSLTDAFLNRDIAFLLNAYNGVLKNGFDGHQFVIGFAEHLRNLLVAKYEETLSLLEFSKHIREKYQEQTQKCSAQFIFSALNICSETEQVYKASKNQRLLVEIALMQMASIGLEENLQKKKE
ncbi:MAG: DNA polymerase III subunit gamma/tau [Bacteroidota bacterium]